MRQAIGFLGELLPRKRLGRALCAYYMLIKLAYLSNSVGQLFLMDRFLGMNSSNRLFGISILNDLFNGRHWQETLIFPRVGFCRVPIKLIADAYTPAMRKTLDRFEVTFLRPDGTFLLHMLRLNAGEIITHEILQALLERYVQHEKMMESKEQSELNETPMFTSSPSDQISDKTAMGKPAEVLADECALKQRLA
ncbi:unnamed protein product [Dibothriocephalus latus]|uniref:Innexin n=1 Tax=Dibothriocephalus latus TaxID=60516 RepID=A0A3P7NTY2_DIBLA|nr:unnamed protein product [Dibothriocephalus latus]